MEKALEINVILDQTVTVDGAGGQAAMLLFHGTFTCGLGSGIILPGGVDTQIGRTGEARTLSARYILEGRDRADRPFHIFVENNGVCREGEPLTTSPVIFTDAPELQWMEREKLTGTVKGNGEGSVLIEIYVRRDEKNR